MKKLSFIETRLGVAPSTTRFAGDWHRRFEAYAAHWHGHLVTANYIGKCMSVSRPTVWLIAVGGTG